MGGGREGQPLQSKYYGWVYIFGIWLKFKKCRKIRPIRHSGRLMSINTTKTITEKKMEEKAGILKGLAGSPRGLAGSLRGLAGSLRGLADSLRGLADSLRGLACSLSGLAGSLKGLAGSLK